MIGLNVFTKNYLTTFQSSSSQSNLPEMYFFFRFLLLTIFKYTRTPYTINPINNTVEIFYNEKSYLKVSNNQWTLWVYKDLQPTKDTLEHNEKTLDALNGIIEENNLQMQVFKTKIKTHQFFWLKFQIIIELNYNIAFDDTSKTRFRLGLKNGVGSIFMAITGNLDASDGWYYNECMNKIARDWHELENLHHPKITNWWKNAQSRLSTNSKNNLRHFEGISSGAAKNIWLMWNPNGK